MNSIAQAPSRKKPTSASLSPSAAKKVGNGEGPQASAATPDGRSTRWSDHREQRKAELIDVARRLIHERGPQVTMEDIAAASGTSKSIVYRYFRDKSELQRALGLHLFNHMHRQLAVHSPGEASTQEHNDAQKSAAQLEAMVVAFVSAASSSRNLFNFVIQPTAHLNHFLESVQRLVRSALPSHMDAAERTLFAAAAVSLVRGTTERWMAADTNDPLRDLSASDVSALIARWLTESPLATHTK